MCALESVTVENYLKAIYQLSDVAGRRGSDGRVGPPLSITPGSVTLMLQRLAESGLVKYAAHQGVRLTKKGQSAAIRVVRNHRLLESFLVSTLGMPWDEIHAEAEALEHAVSDRLAARIDEYLGHPDRDPHGDPIPDSDGKLRTREGTPLGQLPGKHPLRAAAGARSLARVSPLSSRGRTDRRRRGAIGGKPAFGGDRHRPDGRTLDQLEPGNGRADSRSATGSWRRIAAQFFAGVPPIRAADPLTRLKSASIIA